MCIQCKETEEAISYILLSDAEQEEKEMPPFPTINAEDDELDYQQLDQLISDLETDFILNLF